MTIEKGPLAVYMSALPFCPHGTKIWEHYHKSAGTMPMVRLGARLRWTPLLETFYGHSNEVTSVAFSPDGRQLASGSDDSTIRLWNVATGLQIGDELRGHSDWVTSIAFSPNGKQLASGSDDSTIRLWNVAIGLQIGEELRGHSLCVNSVAFSPDGKQLASGSSDLTIRL